MQSVFFEIYRIAGQFDALKGTAKAWLLQYTYHRCLNRRNYLSVRGLYDAKGFAQRRELAEPAYWKGNGNLTSPEVARLVQQGLAALAMPQRKTLELAFFEGFSMAEIADRTKESVGNVRHHYYRGLHALRSLIFAKPRLDGTIVELQSEITSVKS
jgi:RNA polymerase sigma-70 factor (ECF subfamily)